MEQDASSNRTDRGPQPSGLPRHFDHGAFFRDDPFGDEFMPMHGGPPHRAQFTGSHPRLFNDDEFFNKFPSAFANEPSFFRSSLPRRPSPTHQTQSDHQMNDRSGVEREVPIQRHPTAGERSSGQSSPTPASRVDFPSSKRAQPPSWPSTFHRRQASAGSIHGGGEKGGVVEINNANLNSYTHGELNPDKRQLYSNCNSPYGSDCNLARRQDAQQKIPVVVVDDYSGDKTTPTGHNRAPISPAISESAIPLPPPPSSCVEMPDAEPNACSSIKVNELNAANVSDQEEAIDVEDIDTSDEKTARHSSHVPKAYNGQLIELLDEAERRVEQLREAASQLEQEKETLLDILNGVKSNTELIKLANDGDELHMTVERILKRCEAVSVAVNTPRDEQQARALEAVNKLIHAVTCKMQEDLSATKQTIIGFLNACSPEDDGPVDEKFQRMVVECTADDQKKIRRQLAKIIVQVEKAEQTSKLES